MRRDARKASVRGSAVRFAGAAGARVGSCGEFRLAAVLGRPNLDSVFRLCCTERGISGFRVSAAFKRPLSAQGKLLGGQLVLRIHPPDRPRWVETPQNGQKSARTIPRHGIFIFGEMALRGTEPTL